MFNGADAGRMKIRNRPTVKIGAKPGGNDHDIFSTEPPAETPHRMRKMVEPVAEPEDTGNIKVGRKFIEEPTAPEPKAYDPSQSDRYRSTRRHMTSGNVLTGDGMAEDAFERRRNAKAAAATPIRGQGVTDHISHVPEDAPQSVVRPRHEMHLKQQRSHCPFACDDGYQAPAAPIRPLHQGNINHGDVLTGGQMSKQYAGRRHIY